MDQPHASHRLVSRGVSVEHQTFSNWGTHDLKYEAVWREVTDLAEKVRACMDTVSPVTNS